MCLISVTNLMWCCIGKLYNFFFNFSFLIASDTTSVDETDQLAGLDSEPFGETLLEPSGGEEVSETFQRKRSFLQLILQIQEMVISIEAWVLLSITLTKVFWISRTSKQANKPEKKYLRDSCVTNKQTRHETLRGILT